MLCIYKLGKSLLNSNLTPSIQKLNATAVSIQTMYETTKSLGIWESATFMPYQALLPKYDQKMNRRESYLYAGLGLWESRGISLPRAIAAMVGGPSIL